MDWKIILIIILASVIYLILKHRKDKIDQGDINDAQRFKPNVLHDIGLSIESIIPSVHYLDPLAARNILAQTDKDVELGEKTVLYCFEVRTKTQLDNDEISDFKERLQRELDYIRRSRENHCSTPLVVENLKPFTTYVQIFIKTMRR